MELTLYNTLTRSKEVFQPLDEKRVRMYVCGPTVYDFAHIGNARPVIVFDVLFRLLKHLYEPKGTEVVYVRNVTDVDDKINARAAERGILIRELTEETYKNFKEDVAALGSLLPTVEPRATEYIPQMIKMIEELIKGGYAYARDGHVLFDVSKKHDYGKLSNRNVDEMIAGARVEVAPYKKGPMDFVLWKPSPPELPGWESPWGRGRPGWHIECSAMGDALLGRTFDIHGGGIDLVFPHHENEIAQSECAHRGAPLARFWLHNGFLQVEGEKMSKSLGNFVTIRQLLQQNPNNPHWGEVLRLNMLRTHYRQPIDWTQQSVSESMITYAGFRRAVILANKSKARPSAKVIDALKDDLNTPAALAEFHHLANRARSTDRPADASAELVGSLQLLGFDRAIDHVKSDTGVRDELTRQFEIKAAEELGLSPNEIENKVAARNAARTAKNFKESDRIRDELAGMGVILKDNKDGTTSWEVAR